MAPVLLGTATDEKFSTEKVSESPKRLPKRSDREQACPAKRGMVRTKSTDPSALGGYNRCVP